MSKIGDIKKKIKNSAMKGKDYLTNEQTINSIRNVIKKVRFMARVQLIQVRE